MNKLQSRHFLTIGLILVLSSCKISPPVTTDYDVNYDYSKLTHYAWLGSKESSKVLTLNNRRQINAIETILNRKGFDKGNEHAKPNFLLRIHTITDKKTDVDTFYQIWGYHHPHYFWPNRYAGIVVREYEIGTLVLDIVDPVKKEVIWRGSVSRKLGIYTNRTPEERASIALTNADFLLASFPLGRTNGVKKSD